MKEHPKLVRNVTYSKSTGPELAGKIEAGQRAGKVQYNLVVAGYGEIATGKQQELWQRLLPNFEKTLGDVESAYQEGALKMFRLIDGYALTSYYNPNGPLLEYNPGKVAAAMEVDGRPSSCNSLNFFERRLQLQSQPQTSK